MSQSLVGKYLRLTKEAEVRPNIHGINIGSTRIQGYLQEPITPGQDLILHNKPGTESNMICWTSPVVSFDQETMTLVTENSTYKVKASDETLSAFKLKMQVIEQDLFS